MTMLTMAQAGGRDVWRWPLVNTVGLMALLLLAMRDTAAGMIAVWIESSTFNHAFLVPPIVAWLVWRRRGELAPLSPRPTPWLLLPMAGLGLMWWAGHLARVDAAMQLAMVAMLVLSVPLVLGLHVARVITFPLMFSFFAVPIGEFLTPTLMYWTVEVLVSSLRASGIAVYQEGQQLVIPTGRWAVVAACGGIRYLIAMFMVGSLFAYLNYNSARKRVRFILASLMLPVIANWVRAYLVVAIAHLTDNAIAAGEDHITYGWIFFGIVAMAFFYIGSRWADPDESERAVRAAEAAAAARGPVEGLQAWLPLAIVASGLAAALWPQGMVQRQQAAMNTNPVQLELPLTLGRWTSTALPAEAWAPHVPVAARKLTKMYASREGEVVLHLAYFRNQVGEMKQISSVNRFVGETETRWHVLSQDTVQTAGGGESITWRRALLLGADLNRIAGTRDRLTVWRAYWVGDRLVHDDIRGKLVQALSAAVGQPDDAATLFLVSSQHDEAAAQRELSAFVAENLERLRGLLQQARDGR